MNTDTPKIKVLIIDDEKKACTNLKNLLTEFVDSDIVISGIANSTKEAEQLVARHAPDAVFLDIQMPNENAFEFLERISPVPFEVIFVTAYDEFAVRAFKLNAIDYILKPISIPELRNAVNKLREKLKVKKILAEANTNDYLELNKQLTSRNEPVNITLRGINKIEVVNIKEIRFIEAQSSYSRIQFVKNDAIREIIMSNPLSEYEEILPASMFFRIHRSYLVNCTHVLRVSGEDTNELIIKPDVILPVSRRRINALKEFLESNQHKDV